MRRALFLIITVSCLAVACSTYKPSYPSLANQGILALSSSNPYLGTNLFLAKEMETSEVLKNFLRSRGGPTAIQIIEESFNPPKLLLYYPKDKELYAAEPQRIDKRNEWIVRGPFAIDRKDYRTLMQLAAAMNGEPIFLAEGASERFRSADKQEPERVVIPAMPPTPTPKPTPKPKIIIVIPTPTPGEVIPPPSAFTPLTSDQQAIQMSKGYAERTSTGDIIHSASGGQTVSLIAKWYTGSASNAAAISELNGGTPVDEPLTAGTKIKVPIGLLKNLKIMPTDFN